jgi:hypothetical protein
VDGLTFWISHRATKKIRNGRRVDLFKTREHTRERAAVRNVCVREYSEQAVISQSYNQTSSPAHAKLDPLAHACMHGAE